MLIVHLFEWLKQSLTQLRVVARFLLLPKIPGEAGVATCVAMVQEMRSVEVCINKAIKHGGTCIS